MRNALRKGTRRLKERLRNGIAIVREKRLKLLRSPSSSRNRPRLLCLIDLIQDADVILPVAARARDAFDVSLLMTSWLDKSAPQIRANVTRMGFEPLTCKREDLVDLAPDLSQFEALLTASESSAAPHRYAYALVKRANASGMETFTLQHGLENVALTSRADGVHKMASNHVFTWGPPETLPKWVPNTLRRRCIGVGRPHTPTDLGKFSFVDLNGPLIGVFENLHWDRYDQRYRNRFISDLATIAGERTELSFIVKPHPAGRWLTKTPGLVLQHIPNLTIANPEDSRWARLTAGALIKQCHAAITTPSTVALDAAILRKPVAVAAYGLSLPAYAPLTLLEKIEDWRDFLLRANDAEPIFNRSDAFRARHILEGDGAIRSVDAMTQIMNLPK